MLICICKSRCRTTKATYFGRPWLGPQHMWTNSALTKKWAQDSPKCIFTKSKMAAKLHDLNSAWHTCMWGTTRLLHHVSLTMLWASMTELQAMLSFFTKSKMAAKLHDLHSDTCDLSTKPISLQCTSFVFCSCSSLEHVDNWKFVHNKRWQMPRNLSRYHATATRTVAAWNIFHNWHKRNILQYFTMAKTPTVPPAINKILIVITQAI